jgi:vacuolar-type H+-ATPase subunit D/Vma8
MINEYTHVENIVKDLKAIIEREDKRHIMDEHLTASMRNLLEHEIIPQLEYEIDYDPTPQTAYDFFHS